MKIYGLTIVDTECCFIYDGHYRESFTKLDTDLDRLKDYGYGEYVNLFKSCEFENGKDENGFPMLSEEEFKSEYIDTPTIQASDFHYEFDFFESEIEI